MLSKETWPSTKGMSPSKVAQKIIESQNVAKDEYRLGKTKIFIRNPTTVLLDFFILFMCIVVCFRREKRASHAFCCYSHPEALERYLPLFSHVLKSSGFRDRSKWRQRKALIKIVLFYKRWRVSYTCSIN